MNRLFVKPTPVVEFHVGPGLMALLLILCIPLVSCAGKQPMSLEIPDSVMTPCPASPNCVSSDASDEDHKVAPYQLIMPADKAWAITRELVLELPRARIVKETANRLHVECRSAIFGFVDDLELHLRPADGIISVRSASRTGYSDFGVNRRRVEALRASLVERAVIHQQ